MTASDELKAVADRWMEEVWQEGRLDAIDELHALGFVDRSAADRPADHEGFKQGVAQLYAAYPDFRAVTEDAIADDAAGMIAVRWTAVGTHLGAFMGSPPAGRRVTFEGIEILHVENGRIMERWGEWDGISVLRQLGVLP